MQLRYMGFDQTKFANTSLTMLLLVRPPHPSW